MGCQDVYCGGLAFNGHVDSHVINSPFPILFFFSLSDLS